jgi:hypothetical protein
MKEFSALTYLPSLDNNIERILSVWPTNFPALLPVLGSQSRTTRSGLPEAKRFPVPSTARAYTDDLGLLSPKESVVMGVGRLENELVDRDMSHSLIVRSNEPEATQV